MIDLLNCTINYMFLLYFLSRRVQVESGEEYWVVDAISCATLAALRGKRVSIYILDRVVQTIDLAGAGVSGLAGAAAPVEEELAQELPSTPPRAASSQDSGNEGESPKASPIISDDDSPVVATPSKRRKRIK